MSKEIEIWVCPSCDILQGIEVWLENEELKSRCVNCGVPLSIDEVHFLNQNLVKQIILDFKNNFPGELFDLVRFHWLSNRTLGIVFEVSREEVSTYINENVAELVDKLFENKYNISVSVYFE